MWKQESAWPQNQCKGGRGYLTIGERLIKKGKKDSVFMEGKFRLWKQWPRMIEDRCHPNTRTKKYFVGKISKPCFPISINIPFIIL